MAGEERDEREELAALRDKYREMLRLRAANDADRAAGLTHHPSRDELRALARRFPGALAEIDRLALDVLRGRLAELDARLEGDEVARDALPVWARGWIEVHRGLRGALACKAWLRGLRAIDVATRERFVREVDALDDDGAARAWIERLEVVASPPRGRLLDVVLDDVARALGTDRATLREELMPRPRTAPPST